MPRIKIKFGETEVEYEGDQKFISGGLIKLIKDISSSLDTTGSDPSSAGADTKLKRKPAGPHTTSTSSIAQALSVNSGPGLAIAAAAHLNLVKGKDKFSHKELLAEMKGARAFYRKSHHSNLGSTLKSLVSAGRLNHIGGNDYALAQKERVKIEGKLA